MLRHNRIGALRPVREHDEQVMVEQRCLERLRHRVGYRPRRRRAGVMATKTTAKSTAVSSSNRDLTAEIGFLTRALKAPTMREAVARLAERARAEILDP